MKTTSFIGDFQLWAYTVGHGRLLLRSTKSTDRQTQIDILFKDVAAVHLPATLRNPTISAEQATRGKLEELGFAEAPSDGRTLYTIEADAVSGYVLARNMVSDETDREYYEPSPWMT